ncbi:MAG: response regulator transcription factor [Chloroflexi bacterium]|nr:response regulator transcription factor [Chloroflexota bacterium]
MNAVALIVEDDKLIAEVFDNALKHAGYETKICQDGQIALDALNVERPNLVVLDMHLPKVSGLSVLTEIRANSGLDKTWVIVVSADNAITAPLRGEQSADFVLDKPVGFIQLRDLAARIHPDNQPEGRI